MLESMPFALYANDTTPVTVDKGAAQMTSVGDTQCAGEVERSTPNEQVVYFDLKNPEPCT